MDLGWGNLLDNVKWIFEGVGTHWLASRAKKELPKAGETQVQSRATIDKPSKLEVYPCGHASELALRFRKVLDLMNEGRTHNKFTIAKLASITGLSRVGELEKYFSGEEEPTFHFIDHFSSVFGVNRQWLNFGEWTPFLFEEDTFETYAIDYYDMIVSLNPDSIYFVQDTSTSRESGIVLKFADFKYRTLHRHWHISSDVGTTGRRQIYSFYKLIVKLKEEGFYGRCWGRRVQPQQFSRLFSGGAFPGMVIDQQPINNSWWDAFTDIVHEFPIATRYHDLYGEEFIAAQKIVLWFCEQQGEELYHERDHELPRRPYRNTDSTAS